MKHSFRLDLAAVVLVLLSTACSEAPPTSPIEPSADLGGLPNPAARAALEAVYAGNAAAVNAAPLLVPIGVPLPPFVEARLYAITNVAMHDALNSVMARYERYADTGPIDPDADAAAAVLTAAHDAIAGADPAASTTIDAWYATAISALGNGTAVAAGIVVGQRAAAAILANRASDGVAAGGIAPYNPGSNPGDYRFTFPFNTPGFDFFGTGGFADANVWGSTVRPFVVQSNAQFRAPSPYGAASSSAAVSTQLYTKDYDEVKSLGCADCAARTAEQTEIAGFWAENSPTGWNRIAARVAADRRLDAWKTARLLALLQIAEFDGYSTSLESKYYYNFWRPVTAVALAGSDGNSHTEPAANWQVAVFPTPPVPDYPSAHSTAGGAGAAVIESLLPGHGKPFTTTSTSLPGVTRSFSSVAEAAHENALSRIYIGYHFRHATDAGVTQGRAVGNYVATHSLRALRLGN